MDKKERDLIRIGGAGGILLIVILFLALIFLWRTPFLRTQRIEEILVGLYLDRASFFIAQILFIMVSLLALLAFLALHVALKNSSASSWGSLIGFMFGGMGFMILSAHSSLLLWSYLSLVDLYISTPVQSRDVVVGVTEAILGHGLAGGVLDGLLFLAYVLIVIGLIVFGVAMLGSSLFGRGEGVITLSLGIVMIAFLIGYFSSPVGFLIYSIAILLPLWFARVGLKMYALAGKL